MQLHQVDAPPSCIDCQVCTILKVISAKLLSRTFWRAKKKVFLEQKLSNDKDMYELFSIILSEKNLCFPIETEEATNVYHELRQEVLRVIV